MYTGSRMSSSSLDVRALTFISVRIGRRYIDARGLSHPIYIVDVNEGSSPIALPFRLSSFRDLCSSIVGEMELSVAFPPPMSKWKRYVTLTPSDLAKIASTLDAWMRELFEKQSEWSLLVADSLRVFVASAVANMQPSLVQQPYNEGKVRSFAAFLSHFKFECGTEARLVHGQLPRHLSASNRDVFLDSGK